VLLRVTVCTVLVVRTGWLPKARLVGERLTAGVPVLERRAACGLPLALSVMLKASAIQAVERITAFARFRCTALLSMGDTSRAGALRIPSRVRAFHIRLHQLTLCPEREGDAIPGPFPSFFRSS